VLCSSCWEHILTCLFNPRKFLFNFLFQNFQSGHNILRLKYASDRGIKRTDVLLEFESDLTCVSDHGHCMTTVTGRYSSQVRIEIYENFMPAKFREILRVELCDCIEICLLTSERRTASVKAETYCNVYSLSVQHFDSVLRHYPAMRRTMAAVADERLNQLGVSSSRLSKNAFHGAHDWLAK